MQTLLHEFRYALRQLRKSPGFALVSVLTLALGIGANIAVFSVTNAVLLNPSGIPHADGLVALRARYNALPDLSNINVSPPDFGDARDGKDIFSSAAIMQGQSFNYSRDNANPELLNGAKVSSGYFETFEARPYLGRVFTPEEDQPGAERNRAVVSHLAEALRLRSEYRGPDADAQQSAVSRDRRDGPRRSTGRIRWSCGCRSRCLQPFITTRTIATTNIWLPWRGCDRA